MPTSKNPPTPSKKNNSSPPECGSINLIIEDYEQRRYRFEEFKHPNQTAVSNALIAWLKYAMDKNDLVTDKERKDLDKISPGDPHFVKGLSHWLWIIANSKDEGITKSELWKSMEKFTSPGEVARMLLKGRNKKEKDFEIISKEAKECCLKAITFAIDQDKVQYKRSLERDDTIDQEFERFLIKLMLDGESPEDISRGVLPGGCSSGAPPVAKYNNDYRRRLGKQEVLGQMHWRLQNWFQESVHPEVKDLDCRQDMLTKETIAWSLHDYSQKLERVTNVKVFDGVLKKSSMDMCIHGHKLELNPAGPVKR